MIKTELSYKGENAHKCVPESDYPVCLGTQVPENEEQAHNSQQAGCSDIKENQK
jgi:hypothetical protein